MNMPRSASPELVKTFAQALVQSVVNNKSRPLQECLREFADALDNPQTKSVPTASVIQILLVLAASENMCFNENPLAGHAELVAEQDPDGYGFLQGLALAAFLISANLQRATEQTDAKDAS